MMSKNSWWYERKSFPAIGVETSSTTKGQCCVVGSPKSKVRSHVPYVAMAVPLQSNQVVWQEGPPTSLSAGGHCASHSHSVN